MSVEITIHSTGTGTCSLTGKEDVDGMTVTFKDGTVSEAFLSTKGFMQLLRVKFPVRPPKAAAPTSRVAASGNGQ